MLNKKIIHKFQYGKHSIIFETGSIARQATSAILVKMDDTTVLVTTVIKKILKQEYDFFPLTVNYQERSYAAGKFPGSFFRREGRPNENEILISRLIDRSIRPLLPKNILCEIQIIATVLSVDPQINPDVISIIGASAALSISGIPLNGGPIGAARIGYIQGKYILNPNREDIINSSLDLVISSNKNSIIMVESGSDILSENDILNAVSYGYEKQQIIINNINYLLSKIEIPKLIYQISDESDDQLKYKIKELAEFNIINAYFTFNRQIRNNKIDEIKNEVINKLLEDDNSLNENKIINLFNNLEKDIMRNLILDGNKRLDGRDNNTIRDLDIKIGILSRVHGTSLFTRGETQALVATTLGNERNAQNIDELLGDRIDRFILHYNFPPYCVGEIGILGAPKRREIGHGKLVKKAILPVMPDIDIFPYTIRVVSEITESNGSSSMASVCGTSLSLMDAGVPIKSSVAGVAMGLIKKDNHFIVLSDILGDEDKLGDMDFKVAGTREGITALQMDIKIEGINIDIISIILNKAKEARLNIIDVMEKTINSPRKNISKYAPKMYILKINPNKIKDVIGKGGSVIRVLTEETNSNIEVESNGTIKIMSSDKNKANLAIKRIKEITSEIILGNIYNGKVTRVVYFGAFINIKGNKEGLLHLSQISDKYIKNIDNYLKVGQNILVKVIKIDHDGKINLSTKGILNRKS